MIAPGYMITTSDRQAFLTGDLLLIDAGSTTDPVRGVAAVAVG